MSNRLYDKGREGILDDSINIGSDTIKAMLVTTTYTPNTSSHQFVTDIAGGAIVVRSSAFSSKSETGGVFDAADITYTAVTGSTATYIVIYKDTGSDATSRLIALIDTATGLPVIPNGGDINITWDNGSNKIFKL